MTWEDFLSRIALILSSRITLAVFVALYLAVVIADLFKRHLLSRGFVYYPTVLLSPFAAISAVLSLIDATLGGERKFADVFFTLAGAVILMILAITVYIRAHIKPVDKTSPGLKYADPEQINLSSAKRLMGTGAVGMAIFGFIAIYILVIAIEYITLLASVLPFVIVAIVLLFVPGVNIFAALVLFWVAVVSGAVLGVAGTAVGITMLMSFLVTNGCIRYILTTDKTKGQKALFILLSFIPVYNVIYGVYGLLNSREK